MKAFALKLGRIPARLQSAAEAAVSASALQGAELARALAPVESGELRAGIAASMGGIEAAVVSGAAHAAMVEFGTVRMAPQPYLLPMARQIRPEFVRALAQAAQEVLK